MFGKSSLPPLILSVVMQLCTPAQVPKPVISAIVNAASYATGPIAPGEMVVVFGNAFGPTQLVNLQLDSQGNIATTLAGIQLLFDGVPAPLIYVSPLQIAAMVPYSISGKIVTQVQVVRSGLSSNVLPKAVALTAPGIFSADASGKGQAAITNSDGSVNSSANPATPGSYITMYLTGEGQTDPPGSNGMIATGIANVQAKVSVRMAGQMAQLLYAGSAPGNVNGFAQINVVIPVDIPYGGSLPLLVQIGDASTQAEITVAVAGPLAPVPNAPTGLTLSATSTNQIRVTWTLADTLATRFHIERQSGGFGPFAEVAIVTAPTILFNDSDVAPGTDYQYRVRAENDYGYSQYSTVTRISVPALQIAPPTNLQAAALTPNLVIVSWNSGNTNATSLLLERRTGAGGIYSQISTLSNTATSYQDPAVSANTTYTYRMRSQTNVSLSGYSNEIAVTTPGAPLPPAPNLTATAISASQIRLSWTSTTTSILRFRIERRIAGGQYAEVSQPSPTSISFDDLGLIAATSYFYKIRVETASGISEYSNEVTMTTLQTILAAPTNLQANSSSSSEVNLTWTNNTTIATAIRVEYLPGGSTTFIDIGAAVTMTATGISKLQPNTTYSFRVRAQNAAGYSPYSNIVTTITLPVKRTVFLIHGTGQDHTSMQGLSGSLTAPTGVDPARFQVDYQFDFSECADVDFCSANCSITTGAQKLAKYITDSKPPGDIILIGFSLGGLIARDMMANNWLGVLSGRKVAALITLGTPNVGYPYTSIDRLRYCTQIIQSMDGNWRSQQSQNSVVTSTYLSTLNNSQWPTIAYPGMNGVWFAASGRSCSNPYRRVDTTTGCRDSNKYSDGVVCNDSASYNIIAPAASKPTRYFQDPSQMYVHSSGGLGGVGSALILCGNLGGVNNPPLSDPPPGPLRSEIIEVINALR